MDPPTSRRQALKSNGADNVTQAVNTLDFNLLLIRYLNS